MVDNSPDVILQKDNLLPISSFIGSKDDTYLIALEQYLLSFVNAVDVRSKLRQDFEQKIIPIERKISVPGVRLIDPTLTKSRHQNENKSISRPRPLH